MARPSERARGADGHPADLNADFAAAHAAARRSAPTSRWSAATSSTSSPTPRAAKEFEPYIDDVYLSTCSPRSKIEHGLGDPETWASQLPPELFRQLKDRVDIDFAFTNKTDFAADEPVTLDLFVKNVPNLLVKVFEVNTLNFYRTRQREVDTDINLDGLVANAERSPPVRRAAAAAGAPGRFDFPELNKPGRVRHRLHRRRQEQPGAGPQGPAPAARRAPAPPGRPSRVVDETQQAGAGRRRLARRAGVPAGQGRRRSPSRSAPTPAAGRSS